MWRSVRLGRSVSDCYKKSDFLTSSHSAQSTRIAFSRTMKVRRSMGGLCNNHLRWEARVAIYNQLTEPYLPAPPHIFPHLPMPREHDSYALCVLGMRWEAWEKRGVVKLSSGDILCMCHKVLPIHTLSLLSTSHHAESTYSSTSALWKAMGSLASLGRCPGGCDINGKVGLCYASASPISSHCTEHTDISLSTL